jgi:hypothetical protein
MAKSSVCSFSRATDPAPNGKELLKGEAVLRGSELLDEARRFAVVGFAWRVIVCRGECTSD